MNAGWRTTTVASLGTIVTGATPSTKEPELFGSDYPFLTPTDMAFDRIRVSTARGISTAGSVRFSKKIVPAGSVAVVCIASIGKASMTYENTLTNQQVNSIVVDRQNHDPYFVYYLMRQLRPVLQSVAGGAATPIVNKSAFAELPVLVPSLPAQRVVAAVLAAYDELIENNLRRIEILEEMAQAVYREWFVNFRFPGYDDVEMLDSSMGPVPQGWGMATLADCAQKLIDGDWIETKDQGGDDYRLLQVSNIGVSRFRETGNFRFITETTFRRLKCTEIKVGDLLIARMPDPIGRAWLVDRLPWRAVTAVDVAILTPQDSGIGLYLEQFLNAQSTLARVAAVSSGTTRPRVTRRSLADLTVALPDRRVINDFASIAEPNLRMRTLLVRQTETLRTTRDLLLPRLVSGEIDVSDLDIETEWMAS